MHRHSKRTSGVGPVLDAIECESHCGCYGDMREAAEREARNRFGDLFDAAQRAPVCDTGQCSTSAHSCPPGLHTRMPCAPYASYTAP